MCLKSIICSTIIAESKINKALMVYLKFQLNVSIAKCKLQGWSENSVRTLQKNINSWLKQMKFEVIDNQNSIQYLLSHCQRRSQTIWGILHKSQNCTRTTTPYTSYRRNVSSSHAWPGSCTNRLFLEVIRILYITLYFTFILEDINSSKFYSAIRILSVRFRQ